MVGCQTHDQKVAGSGPGLLFFPESNFGADSISFFSMHSVPMLVVTAVAHKTMKRSRSFCQKHTDQSETDCER